MIIFHGSNVRVLAPRLVAPNRNLDFGAGFYTTTNMAQAKNFSENVYRRCKTGSPIVSVYEFDEAFFGEMDTMNFSYPDEGWLDFVSANRNGSYHGKSYDLILGPVANDDVYQTFLLYSTGVITKEQTIEALKIKDLYNQLVFSSPRAIERLRFIEAIAVGEEVLL